MYEDILNSDGKELKFSCGGAAAFVFQRFLLFLRGFF
jgi:hypothetical protein